MPIRVADGLPAIRILESEHIFLMTEKRASSQDIRPLKILLLNLMPTKMQTETQILRLLSNTPLQMEVDLLQTASHVSKNTSAEYLLKFYKTFDEVRHNRYDGMVITGAPVETLDFERVDYWDELCGIMEWTKTNVYSTFHICWGAQAGLYYHYGVPKYPLEKKLSGVFLHRRLFPGHPLLRGFDDLFYAPHSRGSEVRADDIQKVAGLQVLSESDRAGVYIAADENCRRVFVTGHCEYDRDTLANEYFRDKEKGLDTAVPENYFPNDDPARKPILSWRAHAELLYSNWLNFYVYQQTPFDLARLR